MGRLGQGEIDGTDPSEWVDFYLKRHTLQPIELDGGRPSVEQDGDGSTAIVRIAVNETETTGIAIQLRANTWTSVNLPIGYSNEFIWIKGDSTRTAQFDQTIQTIRANMEVLNSEIRTRNRQLPEFITPLVARRQEELGARRSESVSLADALEGELVLTPEAKARRVAIPKVAESIERIRAPQPNPGTVVKMDADDFSTILGMLDSQLKSWERTPGAVGALDEEKLRDLLLSTLNVNFDQMAIGEAFSKKGKTDIFLPVPNGGVFIAECKIWRGPAALADATEQILGYLAWRDAYGVVLVFSRNVGFPEVLNSSNQVINALDTLDGDASRVGDRHWVTRQLLEDRSPVEIHYLVYNLYVA